VSDLREADWSDVESEFLVGGCFDGDVLDWEHFEIVGVNLEDTSSPRAVLVLAFIRDNISDILDVGGFVLIGENSEFGVAVEAVVCDVLSNSFTLHSEHLDLDVRCGVCDLSLLVDISVNPDVFVVSVVFLGVNIWNLWPDASFVGGGVAVDENSIVGTSGVRIDPVVT